MVDRGRPGRVRYRFSPLERRGVIAGWRGGQIASVAIGLVVGVFALRSRPTAGGVLLAVAGVGAAVALAFWPIRGRTGEQWLPLLARRLLALSTGTHLQLASGPRSGHLASVDLHGRSPEAAVVEPGGEGSRTRGRRTVFSGVEIIGVASAPDQWPPDMGMVVDRPARTVTAVLAVRGHSFALLGHGDQDSTIAGWARVLSSMAREGSDVHRVQWLESCLPDDGGAVRQHRSRHAVLGPGSAAGRSYQTLLDESSPATRRHRVLLALSVHTSRSARSIRGSGGGPAGAGAVLGREILSLQRALDGTDVIVDGVLGPGALRRVIREASCRVADTRDPDGPEAPSGRVVIDRGCPGSDDDPCAGAPWPMAMEPHWDAIHADATWHTTYWIAEWPRVDVTPDFLGPLLFSPLRRTIALIMEPVSPSRAARQVAQARTADIADGELRRRSGFLVTARQVREKESVEERDVELADGHAQYRFSGYVTVTGDSREELRGACAAVEQAAGQAGVELRLLYGEQDVAFTCSLPLGRGLS
jgi:hypothetical protein